VNDRSWVSLENLHRDAPGHVRAMVAALGVVAGEEALQLGLKLGEGVEALAVEGRSVELLEDRGLHALADRIVVGRTGRDAVVGDPELGHVLGEGLSCKLGTVVAEHAPQLDPDVVEDRDHLIDECCGEPRRLLPDDQLRDRRARRRVDRGELEDRADALQLSA